MVCVFVKRVHRCCVRACPNPALPGNFWYCHKHHLRSERTQISIVTWGAKTKEARRCEIRR